jgi:hypothetical protein
MENTDLLALISRLENMLDADLITTDKTMILTLCAELRQRIEREQKDEIPSEYFSTNQSYE